MKRAILFVCLLLSIAFQVLPFSAVASSNETKQHETKTSLMYCAIRPDSITGNALRLDMAKVKKATQNNVFMSGKKELSNKYIKPQSVDPQMIKQFRSDIILM